ncbi:MAG: PrsW family glutamic-type intramembrane protease [Luteolibacter sp.]|uniref:PrsW family glutamic-type intramembrane protease n=1 Tax=Luteolibacter sp. TaxID=1962973 RepID=UPI003263D98E
MVVLKVRSTPTVAGFNRLQAKALPLNLVINFACPHCAINISTEPEYAGAEADCPSCNQPLVIPNGEASSHPVKIPLPTELPPHIPQSNDNKEEIPTPGLEGIKNEVTGAAEGVMSPDTQTPLAPPPALSLASLKPLFVCLLLFGWVANWFLPGREIDGSLLGQITAVTLIGLPALLLAIAGGLRFLQPTRFPVYLTVGALLFTMTVGITGLLCIQELGTRSLEYSGYKGGKQGAVLYILKFVGFAYESTYSPSIWIRFFGYIFGVGLWEEITKLLPLFYLAHRIVQGDEKFKIGFRTFLTIGFFSGLGFGIGEALHWYSPWGVLEVRDIGSNVLRWFACVPSHAVYATIDAAILWLLAPQLKDVKDFYGRLLLFAAAAFTVAVVHGTYNVISSLPMAGITLDAASILLLYWVVDHVEKTRGVAIDPLVEPLDSGTQIGWLKKVTGVGTRLKRLYIVSCVMILGSLFLTSAGGHQSGSIADWEYEAYMRGYTNPAAGALAGSAAEYAETPDQRRRAELAGQGAADRMGDKSPAYDPPDR